MPWRAACGRPPLGPPVKAATGAARGASPERRLRTPTAEGGVQAAEGGVVRRRREGRERQDLYSRSDAAYD